MQKFLSFLLLPSLALTSCTSSELEKERERSAMLEKNMTDLQTEVTLLKTENEKNKNEFQSLKENIKTLENQIKNTPPTPPPAAGLATPMDTPKDQGTAEALPPPPNLKTPPAVPAENINQAEKIHFNSIEVLFELKKYSNVLTALRSFYLKYPKGSLLQRAKLLEARTYEKLGKAERATTVYAEVISISPQTDAASEARAGMLHMQKGITP